MTNEKPSALKYKGKVYVMVSDSWASEELEKSDIEELHHSDFPCPLDDCDCDVFYADLHQDDCNYNN